MKLIIGSDHGAVDLKEEVKRVLKEEFVEVEVEDVPATKLDEAASKQSMDMKRFSLCFNGRIDVNMIANSLLHILGDNAVGEVEIVCNLG